MKLYFAVGANWYAYRALRSVGGKRMLISFAYVPRQVLSGKETFYKFYGEDIDPFIDSGAYTVKHTGKEVKLEDYIDFLKQHNFPVYANLDVIGSWEKTLKNQQLMEKEGLKPLPVWHERDPFEQLKAYVGSYDYVALGFKSRSSKERANLSATIFDQYPDTKFHMFAITQPEVMMQYPFYSVDSSTWLNSIKYGALLTPWGYVHVARERLGGKRHVRNMTRLQKIKWETYFEGFGFKLEDLLGDDYTVRAAYSAKFFIALETAINNYPLPKKTRRMLDSFYREKKIDTISYRILEYARLHKTFHQDEIALLAANEEWNCQIETIFRTLRKLAEDENARVRHVGGGYWKYLLPHDDKTESLTQWFG